jgi:hypothetical protein
MDKRELALSFIERFCAGDVAGLERLLAPDLSFRGPLLRCESAAAYLESLRADPPGRCGYRVLALTEEVSSVSVLWIYDKPGKAVTITQLFGVRDGKIGEIVLVFEPGAVAGAAAH